MRYGIISDIHGNLEALQAVLEKLHGVDKLICPGDVVGYGPDPLECCRLVRSLDAATVLGNHDAAVVDRMDLDWFNPDARAAALWTRGAIDERALGFLESLRTTHEADEFLMVHGSLTNPLLFPYIYSCETARECFEIMQDHTLCFIGHSHLSQVYIQQAGDMSVDQLSFPGGGTLDLKPGFRYIVNCGSVGQPRDGNPNAACAVYDSDAGRIEILRAAYDIPAVQAKMRDAGLPPFLVERLEYGH